MSQAAPTAKIAQGSLRDFIVTDDGDARETVIVEAATAPLVDELPRYGFSGVASGKVKLRKPAEEDDNTVGILSDHLKKLTGRKPKWLKFADAFIVEGVTPEQVRLIASWPQTGMIRPNRVHHTRV